MDNVSILLSVISTLISSVALVGVMIGLLLQARQLRVNNVQIYRDSHVELTRMAIDYPEAWVDQADAVSTDPEELRRHSMANWQVQHLKFGYSIGEITEGSLRHSAQLFFAAPYRREWWGRVAFSYEVGAKSRREREFVRIVSAECERVITSNPDAKPMQEFAEMIGERSEARDLNP